LKLLVYYAWFIDYYGVQCDLNQNDKN